MSSEKDLNDLSARIDDLVQRIEFIGDPAVRANVVTLVQSLMDLHRRGFERIGDILSRDDAGRRILGELAADELLGGLLLLYGFHPDGLEARVKKALEKLRDDLRPSGNEVHLLDIQQGVVRLRLGISGGGCSSTSAKLENDVKGAIYAAAPDVETVEIEKDVISSSPLVQLQVPATLRTQPLAAEAFTSASQGASK